MIHDAPEGVESDMAFADLLVPVLVRGKRVHRVVDVNRAETIQSDDPVEFGEHVVQTVDDIITAVPDVTGVKTDSKTRS